MLRILILGATGTIGSAVRQTLLKGTDYKLILFSRSVQSLRIDPNREKIIAGSVTNNEDLDKALEGQDIVFAALSGNLGNFAKHIIDAMHRKGVKRLIFITSMGIYNEIPASIGLDGNLDNNPMLQTYRDAADVIENSDINYTIIRPGWFTRGPVNYEVTHKGVPFGGHDVSISSIADLVMRLAQDQKLYNRESVGINTPN